MKTGMTAPPRSNAADRAGLSSSRKSWRNQTSEGIRFTALEAVGEPRSTRNDILASPVFADNRIFIASGLPPEFDEEPGRLVCLDPTRQGDISSELAVDGAGNIIPHRRIQAVDPPIFANGVLYLATHNTLFAIAAGTD